MTTATKSLFDMELVEAVYTHITEDMIDEDLGIIKNVKVLGKTSKNGPEYSEMAMREGVSLYEDVTVNIDHPDRSTPTKERGWMEGLGMLKNARFVEGDGIYADLHYWKTHPYAPTLVERAKRGPNGFGLSHNADGSYVKAKGRTVIEQLRAVRSVDVVGKPATTKGLYESVEETPTMKKYSLKSLVESFGSADEKKHLALLENAVLDREVEIEEGSESVKAGFSQAVADAHEEDIDEAGKVLAAEKLLKEGKPKEVPQDPPADTEKLAALEEQVRTLTAKNQRMELEREIQTLCESEKFKPDEFQTDTLMLMESADKRIKLIESWKSSGRPERSGRREHIEDLGSYEEERAKLSAAK